MSASRSGGAGRPEPFAPKFSETGLMPAVAVDAGTGEVLMVAYMNREALEATRRTRKATFYSRSRKKLWVKGETSGNYLAVEEIRIDCDQDCLLVKVRLPAGGAACHTGERSCFFRKLSLSGPAELARAG
ncbi:MAG: phosphoribosyl-AMP cyclohydrolase [Verrucomicrobia bacterium]|nr:phosphoribosyl-AMP cyclohydrolase [Verrucomicrobiota bacterium]NBR45853.1 phosphoribosyl-AMP cyclohydrolase [Verrucomicrobiota bacterium]NBR63398.1 phosphoribosyl-AMP cyclohydrolase [Verrucomicrobiota bacterium]NBU69053.1 phosphoribosyl-AMP cyclohydrolase [Verrucomicrobiota bacterium]NDC00068.1 phosphoribosyl-AMP cyclohydrolase [Verrucomicrobiota bacterium]